MLPKAYDSTKVEDRIYKMWEESGVFIADAKSTKEPFTISMPPPNATGHLHLGNAVMLALEDIFIRFHRMRGKEVLWVPGTDHAAIATESVVIQRIQEEERIPDPRARLGREELLRRIANYVEKSQGTIRSQIRKMGASCDWSRERYTFELALNRCVNEVFKKMVEDGLIYRGHRIVNWDPKMQTTVSDDEIKYREERAPFYTLQYGPFRISTARPETKFGDKYIVMHPDDERYARYAHGENFECEWINGAVTATIIKDKAVNPEFGTGCMTITPWHDHADFEIAERHNLEKEQIIDFEGKLLPIAGEFAGLSIEEARPRIVEKLKSKGLLVSVDEQYVHRVAMSHRGGGIVEPQIKEQWFIDVHKRVVDWAGKKMSLKDVMQHVIRRKEITIVPGRFEKVYFHWIDNLRDWCISRQIWWGHRVPVWYRGSEKYVGVQPPEGDGWEQDPDTLDTWFSSALWTWSTLIDPRLTENYSLSFNDLLEQSSDYKKFHPTSIMETGYDILFFWVARMILMTTYATGQIPFKKVYLHGLVRTREGKKMSKSDPSTCIDPLNMIPRYGADALRMSMIVGQSPGNDFRLYEEKIAGYRNFVNKLWNAARFVLLMCEKKGVDPHSIEDGISNLESGVLSMPDRALLSELQDEIDRITGFLEEYSLSVAGEDLYSFVWSFFCDWYLEISKGESNPHVLVYSTRIILQLLHPYCPFVTEELWGHFKPQNAGFLMKHSWPGSANLFRDREASTDFALLTAVISTIRRLRVDQGIEAQKNVAVVVCGGDRRRRVLESHKTHVMRLARLSDLEIRENGKDSDLGNRYATATLPDATVYLLLEGLVDIQSLMKMVKELQIYIRGLRNKLENEQFLKKAPSAVVECDRGKLKEAEVELRRVEERLALLRES